jgi:hypothetical protein
MEGNKNTAHRIVTAENNFVESLVRIAGCTEEEARKAMRTMLNLKVAKLDAVIGKINVKHGAFLEPDAIRNAIAY